MANSKTHPCDISDDLLSVEDALKAILESVDSPKHTEWLAIRDSLDRTITQDITAPFNVPPYANSAMDGYAVRTEDIKETTQLKIAGKSLAGHPYSSEIQQGQCIRIMTGAVIPDGANAVIMQECVTVEGDAIKFTHQPNFNENIRHAGEDMQQGDTVLHAGKTISSADLGLLASLGIAEIKVYRKPTVVFFSTGDELKGVGETLSRGDIYDSNRYTLYGLLKKQGVDFIDLGIIPDQPDQIEQAFQQASQMGDVIITSGGVSVGEADFVTDTLNKLGQVGFWRIAMKPGKPLAFGKLGKALFFGLPGNPVSVMATFMLFVRPALQKLKGSEVSPPRQMLAITDTPLRKDPGRTDHQRGIYTVDQQGQCHVTTTGLQGSHVLSSMSKANCFIVLERERSNVEVGEEVMIYPFDGII